MCNSIKIPDSLFSDAEDGDEVEATIKGTIEERDGQRFVSVSSLDGEEVEEEDDKEADSSMDAEDALDRFFNNPKGK